MAFTLKTLLTEHQRRNYELHESHINPRFSESLKAIGFDRCYSRGEGCYLWDTEGQQYLDMLAGYGVAGVGRSNPQVINTLVEFLNCGYPNLAQMDAPLLSGLLAEKLKARMPNQLERVYFTNSGTEGNETAIKFARCATGRSTILFADGSYHGMSYGSLSICGQGLIREGFTPLLPDCIKVPFNDLTALEKALFANEVAAFIVEPIQGRGITIPDSSYLAEAARLCRQHGALFVADEVLTGIGRTGHFLAVEHDGAGPDMVVLSKALSGGYVPVGAVLMRKAIYEKVYSSPARAVIHSSTFGQGNFAMAAGLATLDYLDTHNVIDNAARMGDVLGTALQALQQRYSRIAAVRWRGVMLGIDFAGADGKPLPAGWALEHVVKPLMVDHRILTRPASLTTASLMLIPPLIIGQTEVDYFLTAFEAVLQAVSH